MEESISTHSCKKNYDLNMSPSDGVKFRRCYGNVKLSPTEAENTLNGDEFDVIIDQIQDVNEDVFLTRECNNFDLINFGSSQNSLHSSKRYYINTDIKELTSLQIVESKFSSAIDSSGFIVTEETNNQQTNKLVNIQPQDSCVSNKTTHLQSKSESNSPTIKSASYLDVFSEKTISDCFKDVHSIEKNKSSSSCREDKFNMKPTNDNENLLKSSNLTEITSIPEKMVHCQPNDEIDSDDSSKWDKKIDDKTYNAQYFYNSGNPGGDNCADECRMNIKQDLREESATIIKTYEKNEDIADNNDELDGITREEFLNDSFDNESLKSQDTSRSASSAFESAMSSSDMMSPFGTPRNSLSKHSSLGGSRKLKKKLGFNFASLTSENIPNTLNRLSTHKAIEKNFMKSTATTNVERKDCELNSNIPHNKVHSSHSLRKLLNLTSHKKSLSQSEPKALERLPTKKIIANDNQILKKESLKSISLKSRDKKMNIKEFYSSKRKKLKSLVETERLSAHLATFYNENTEPKDPASGTGNQTIMAQQSKYKRLNECQDTKQNFTESETIENVLPTSRESKSKFVSKIPRPVSKRELNLKSTFQTDLESSEFEYDDQNHLNRTSSANLAAKSNRSDKSDTRSRPSDGSESSYKHISIPVKTKEEKPNNKNWSKTVINTPQIDTLRSKYWMKEDKTNFTSIGNFSVNKVNKKVETQEKDNKKVKSIMNVAFQSYRQESRIAYGKMVRVKTAPLNRSIMHIREKSILKEPSKPDTDYPWKSAGRRPSKVVSIGAFDVNKVD